MRLFSFVMVLGLFCPMHAFSESMPAADAATLDDSGPSRTSASNTAPTHKPNGSEKLPYSEQELNNFDPAQFQRTNNLPVDTD